MPTQIENNGQASAANYSQSNRPMAVTTPLGKDAVLLVGFSGHEGISQLFDFQLDLLAENRKEVPFEKLLGQPVTVELSLASGSKRYFNGICNRLSQGERDNEFTAYRMEMVPLFWLLTRKAQSRIFQQMSVPAILTKVLKEDWKLDVAGLEKLEGPWHPRDFCVQYRETDFNFACRLMEEEGICYFFKHTVNGHQLILANTPQSHPQLPDQSTITYEKVEASHLRDEDRIYEWEKAQELRSGKYTLWDHSFELPHKHLEADKPILPDVQVGQVKHQLRVGGNDRLELYDYPGRFAQRFDGVDRGGGDRPADLQKIFEDNQRTVGIRMQQEALPGLVIHGASNCRQLVSGHWFTLQRHYNADGKYLLTGVQHAARLAHYRSGESSFQYHNLFTCIPLALPYRPPCTVPKPVLAGTQTAVVVGPKESEVYTDKYGRVKVQFFWDREGKKDLDSSCWIRVAQFWAGKRWGAHFWPRVGQEVVVAFTEGDPDQPIIVGSVYNAENMPPYDMPKNQTRSGIKTQSTPQNKDAHEHFNELRFEDKKGHEEVYLHAERNLTTVVESCEARFVGASRTTTVHYGEKHTVDEKGRETVIKKGNETLVVEDGKRETSIAYDDFLWVQAGNYSRQVDQGNDVVKVDKGDARRSVPNGDYFVMAKTVHIGATERMRLYVGNSEIVLTPDRIEIYCPNEVYLHGYKHVDVRSQAIDLNGNEHVQVSSKAIDLN
jgi:type VI secretion system secreted protein VgrG